MFDLQLLAYQADITRVVDVPDVREISCRAYPEIGVTEDHHSVSHHGNKPETAGAVRQDQRVSRLALRGFVEKLQSTPDGDGSLLDHSLILYGSGLGDGNGHTHFNLPAVLVGGAGGSQAGVTQVAGGQPMANLLGQHARQGRRADRDTRRTGPGPLANL